MRLRVTLVLERTADRDVPGACDEQFLRRELRDHLTALGRDDHLFPLFYTAVLTQMTLRDGFEPVRHPLSLLVLGRGGWVQVTTFVVTGLLVVAGVFRTDPYNGFPQGADPSPTGHGLVHSAAPTVSAVAGLTLYVVLARRFARTRRRTWARATVATLVLVGDAIGWVWLTALFLDLHRTSGD